MEALLKKMNFKNHSNVVILNMPEEGLEEWKTDFPNAAFEVDANTKSIDFAIAFCLSAEDVVKYAAKIIPLLSEDAPLWFCYAKGSSKKYKSAINRDNGWSSLGSYNIEPVRQIAIDEDWSALRFRPVQFIKNMARNDQMTLSEAGREKASKGKKQ